MSISSMEGITDSSKIEMHPTETDVALALADTAAQNLPASQLERIDDEVAERVSIFRQQTVDNLLPCENIDRLAELIAISERNLLIQAAQRAAAGWALVQRYRKKSGLDN